ncbi:hypothetical protein TELCIR_03704 [Teladorsagia circumcincta]|uniref:Uncharacterized protein n=1 Tax=Teladorsagia circumcincta TaxID=45464 RepID=A0A2G9UVM9_TELCI|nr:hypothetical protein TELCIR_03704 [Teladorsagia circumcincta]
MLGQAVDRQIIVDGVYDKQELDIETPEELLQEVGEYGESIDHSLNDAYGDEAEQERHGDDPYGGMPLDLYDNIVEFKRTGTYPANIGARHDRSALSHWRARCLRFVLADDNETLLYYNPSSSVNDQPKVVVKRGEVRRVIERIHDLIGHLGQKRTYNEHEVRAAAVTRMTTYTFKETANELRGRFARPNSGIPTNFRRQPYIKRTRYSPYASGFILPYAAKHKNDEPGFIEIYQEDRPSSLATTFNGHVYPVEELPESQQIEEPPVGHNNMQANLPRPNSMSAKAEARNSSHQMQAEAKREGPSTSRTPAYTETRPKKNSKGAALGLAARFNLSLGDTLERADPCDNTEFLLSSYEAIQSRPEMSVLPPIMLMPSVDPEVIHMQKELLMRQLRLQRMQEKVLQAQFNSVRLPIARYEEIDPDGERVQLLGEEEDDDFIGETVEEEQELNVMNSGDESGDEMIRSAPR